MFLKLRGEEPTDFNSCSSKRTCNVRNKIKLRNKTRTKINVQRFLNVFGGLSICASYGRIRVQYGGSIVFAWALAKFDFHFRTICNRRLR